MQLEQYLPLIKLQWNRDPYVTGPDKTRHYPWIFIGKIVSVDSLVAYQFVIGAIHLTIAWS